jgi:hypothetical protein
MFFNGISLAVSADEISARILAFLLNETANLSSSVVTKRLITASSLNAISSALSVIDIVLTSGCKKLLSSLGLPLTLFQLKQKM